MGFGRGDKKDKKPAGDARQVVLRLLGRREYSRSELLARLLQRGFEKEDAEHAIAAMVDLGLQSDERRTRSIINGGIQCGRGPRRILADGRQAGLDEDAIKSGLDAAGVDWSAAAADIIQRRFGAGRLDIKTRNRAYNFLVRRGFPLDAVIKALGGR